MKLKLQNEIASPQDLKEAISEVQKYSRWASQAVVKSRVTGTAYGQPPPVSQLAVDLVNQWHGQQAITQKSLDELIIALKDFESSAKRVSITLAAVPPGDLKTELTGWCRKNLGSDVLVDFKYNSTILGGMVVRWGSRIFDWSFRRQILASLDKFPETLRRV
jgi:hypothetical protein